MNTNATILSCLLLLLTIQVKSQECIKVTLDPTTENVWGFAKDALIGDLNNDGFNDLLISHEFAGGISEVDFFYIKYGPLDTSNDFSVSEAEEIITIAPFFNNDISEFYYTKPAIADINNDGVNDLFLTQYNSAFVFYGPINSSLTEEDADIVFKRDESFIDEILSVGDVTGDGISDVMVLQKGYAINANLIDQTGIVQIFEGPFASGTLDLSQLPPLTEIKGVQDGDLFGSDGKAIEDINGDGLNDISIYASERGICIEIDPSTGLCQTFGNRQSGTLAIFTSPIAAGNFTIEDANILFRNPNISVNNQNYIQFGRTSYYGSDYNGDEIPDFAISSDENNVYIFEGPFDQAEYNYTNAIKITGSSNEDFGKSIVGIQDLDNDAKDELIVGAPSYGIGTGLERFLGRAYVFSGPDANTSANQTGLILNEGEVLDTRLASKIVIGDINDDGISDLGFTPDVEFSGPGYFSLCYITEDLFDILNSTDENSKLDNQISIFPNPAFNTFSIQNDSNIFIEKISIHTLNGTLLRDISKNAQSINISDLSNGVYFVQLTSGDISVSKKLVIVN